MAITLLVSTTLVITGYNISQRLRASYQQASENRRLSKPRWASYSVRTMEDLLLPAGTISSPEDAIAALNKWLHGGESPPLSSVDNNKNGGTRIKLYGRSDEQEQILQVYQRITAVHQPASAATTERRTEFILIEGETGSGKTALAVNHHQQPADDAGYCVLGKFDQLVQLQKPHSAFVEALTKYAEAVLERGQVEQVRRRVEKFEKDTIPVLANMVPALAKIL